MKEGTNIPIEIKGICRSKSILGVEDGCCEDLINLRFKDGSWRTSGDGKRVTSFSDLNTGHIYSQIYVHTGSDYKHLLGVDSGVLYWFGNISPTNDETFTALTTRQSLGSISGDLYISQNGHLLTIIDEADDFEYWVFKTGTGQYKKVVVDVNGKQTDRTLFPFGNVHFNLYSDANNEGHVHVETDETLPQLNSSRYWDRLGDPKRDNLATDGFLDAENQKNATKYYHNKMVAMIAKATESNQFTRPFLAIAAIKLYDGSFVYSSNPVLLYPRQVPTSQKAYIKHQWSSPTDLTDAVSRQPTSKGTCHLFNNGYYFSLPQYADFTEYSPLTNNVPDGGVAIKGSCCIELTDYPVSDRTTFPSNQVYVGDNPAGQINPQDLPVYCNGITAYRYQAPVGYGENTNIAETIYRGTKYTAAVIGSQICCSIDNADFLRDNADIFQSVCIFVTQQADLWSLKADEDDGDVILHMSSMRAAVDSEEAVSLMTISYKPKQYSDDKIRQQLFNSPFFLLKEYDRNSIYELISNPIVELSGVEDEGVLNNITQQDRLSIESSSRMTYLPKVQYNYNGRLHIANYKSTQFHGFPLDQFQLNNLPLKYSSGHYYPNDADYPVLRNLVEDNKYLSWERNLHTFFSSGVFSSGWGSGDLATRLNQKGDVYAFVEVEIETNDGTQKVNRYIEPYDVFQHSRGHDFVQDIDPLLTFPDHRAKKMRIYFMEITNYNNYGVLFNYKEVNLRPHPYLNIAYYVTNDLKPITMTSSEIRAIGGGSYANGARRYVDGTEGINYSVSDSPDKAHPQKVPTEVNTEELFPNGLKVSKVNNPMFFPVEATYRCGSSEILALMSNTVAVGTGQTGDAPLYIFCKDGIYAAFVDASGEMVYKNLRLLARDVCSVKKSVTPVDDGVVFITERGIMKISGAEVQEIGQEVEGKPFSVFDSSDKAVAIMYNAKTKPAISNIHEVLTNTDFLSYLNDNSGGARTIINYNHNNRELMVSNPNYAYSYIYDRYKQWSRRTFTADEYINNFPTSYRLVKVYTDNVVTDCILYKCDKEQGETDEADNGMYILSAPIKLGDVGFKKAFRFAIRGEFKSIWTKIDNIASVHQGHRSSYGVNVIYQLEGVTNELFKLLQKGETIKLGDTECVIRDKDSSDNIIELSAPYEEYTNASKPLYIKGYIGCYVFGSYDGRQWALLGGNERRGSFKDIGCLIERTNVKFFRFVLAGQLTGKSRIDFAEISAEQSILNNKLR